MNVFSRSLLKPKAMTIFMFYISMMIMFMMMPLPMASMVSKQRLRCCYTKECKDNLKL